MEPVKYCLTTWNEVLKVNRVKGKIVDVSDPDCVDAGQTVSADEVSIFFEGFRVQDKLPNNNEYVRTIVQSGQEINQSFKDGKFESDIKYGQLDKVILWGEADSPF